MTEMDAATSTGQLGLWDRAALGVLFPLFTVRWCITFLLHKSPGLHWRQRLALTFLQAQRRTFPVRHIRWLVRRVSTDAAVVQYCNKHSIIHEVITLDAAATPSSDVDGGVPPPTLHILTPPGKAKDELDGPTLLYFHGGGFVNPLRGAAHMPFIMRCAAACRAARVVVLEYALAPEHPYPAQLVQCVATLRHLLAAPAPGMGLRPEDIVLAGDSAGGQLVGALLAHVVRPSPYAPPLTLDGQLRAALLVSPFVRLPTDVGTYETNDGRDYLTRPQVDAFKAAWRGREDEIWANMCGVEGSGEVWGRVFARGADALVRRVMVTVGTAEIFLDCCRAFAREHVRAETVIAAQDTDFRVFEDKDVVLAECEGEVHVQVALDSVVGYGRGVMERAVMSWLRGV